MSLPPNILAAIDVLVEREIKMPFGCCKMTRRKVEQARRELREKMINGWGKTEQVDILTNQ